MQEITAGGPAARAGLRGGSGSSPFQASDYRRGGDVITKVGPTPITNADDLSGAVARYKPGQTVPVVISRDGQAKTLQVRLTERPLGNPATG